MRKLLVAMVILGLVAWWYFAWYSRRSNGAATKDSDIPAVRVDESALTEAGRRLLNDVKSRIETLRSHPNDTKRKFEVAKGVANDLRLLGDYHSAAEWYLKYGEWFESLTPQERRTAKVLTIDGGPPVGAPFEGHWMASVCYLLAGNQRAAFEAMEAFMQKYPNDPRKPTMMAHYRNAKKDLSRYVETLSHFRANPRFLK